MLSKYSVLLVGLTLTLIACGDQEKPQQGTRLTLDSVAGTGTQVVQKEITRTQISAVTSTDWPQHLGRPSHEIVNAALSSSPRLVAAVTLGTQKPKREFNVLSMLDTHSSAYGSSQPIIVGNTIYHYDSDGILHAISSSGARLWKVSLIPSGETMGDGFGGGLAYGNGVIYAATGYGEVVAVDAQSGGVKWRYVQTAPLRKAPLLADGHVIIMSAGSVAIGLDAATGVVNWRRFGSETEMPTRLNAGVPAALNGQSVLSYASGALAMVNISSGQDVWSKTAVTDSFTGSKSVLSDITGDPVLTSSDLIVGTQSGVLDVEKGTGLTRWASDTGTKGPLIVNGNSIFGITPTNEIFRLNRSNGALAFKRALPRYKNPDFRFNRIEYNDLRLAQNSLWVTDDHKFMRRYDINTGDLIATFELQQSFASAPVIGSNMMVGIGENGQLLIYR